MIAKLQKRWILLASIFVYLTILFTWTLTVRSLTETEQTTSEDFKNPAELKLQQTLANNTFDVETKLKLVADFVKKQLTTIQVESSCGAILLCGHDDNCGLGCQLHHRSLCLAISLALNVPLVHGGQPSWPYSDNWNSVFKRLGSFCPLEDYQIRFVVDWRRPCDHGPLIQVEFVNDTETTVSNHAFTFSKGLPMPAFLANTLNSLVPDPFTWVVGMFLNYTMELNDGFELEIENQMKSFGKIESVIGAHVRRTDKVQEAPNSLHNVSEYADQALKFHGKFGNKDSAVTVLVATDDPGVLQEFQSRYKLPRWRILAFAIKTPPDGASFEHNLKAIVRDVLMLAHSDFVVCGFSSNICRLIWELKTFQGNPDLKEKFRSLDDEYQMILLCNQLPSKIVQYEGTNIDYWRELLTKK